MAGRFRAAPELRNTCVTVVDYVSATLRGRSLRELSAYCNKFVSYISYIVSTCIIIKTMLHMFTAQFLYSRIFYLVNEHDTIKCLYMR